MGPRGDGPDGAAPEPLPRARLAPRAGAPGLSRSLNDAHGTRDGAMCALRAKLGLMLLKTRILKKNCTGSVRCS